MRDSKFRGHYGNEEFEDELHEMVDFLSEKDIEGEKRKVFENRRYKEKIEVLAQRLREVMGDREALRQERDESKARTNVYKNAFNWSESQLEEVQKEKETLEGKLDAQSRDYMESIRKRNDLSDRVDRLKTKLQKVENVEPYLQALERKYQESIRKQNALTDHLDSLKEVIDERDDLRSRIFNLTEAAQERHGRHLERIRTLIIERDNFRHICKNMTQEKKMCQTKLDIQLKKLEEATKENTALQVRVSRYISPRTCCTPSNDATTGVNAEVITSTLPGGE